jgi:biotin operon repressor
VTNDLPEYLADVRDRLTAEWQTGAEMAEDLDKPATTVSRYVRELRDDYGVAIEGNTNLGYRLVEDDTDAGAFEWADEPVDRSHLPDLGDVDADGDPDPEDLTDREEYIVGELQTGTTPEDLADDLDERETVVTQHLRDLKRQGWHVYVDESAGHVAIEGEHVLRSSEHTGTRTRKANRWWELRHNELVREFAALQTPDATLDATAGHEDWVLHLTDLHAGDRVRRDDGTVVYATDQIPAVIDYVTEQALALADKHNSTYDAAHLLWGGDFVTNEGIYEGQFEDLDAWLDEQHDTLVAPLLRQLKAFAERFPTVQVVCQVGNHGQHRASGTSKQANADLILYKHLRNTVAQLREHGDVLQNVTFKIGQAAAYRNFDLRGGRLQGHLRHGQHRRPQAETSARKKEWLATLRDHEFDVAHVGHHHVSGRIPWDGPPVLFSPSPKPAGEFVERLGERVDGGEQGLATAHGVSDDGLTTVFPIDTRNYDR